jgi:Uma2 family endonuclease
MATRNLHAPLLTVEEFLEIEFPSDTKAELDNGVIRMMAGGTVQHAEVQSNILSFLRNALRGSGCKPFGSDLGVRTNDMALRYPDITVICGKQSSDDDAKAINNPSLIVEVLSPSTRAIDLGTKLTEYRAIASVTSILFVDPALETVRLIERTSPAAWTDTDVARGDDVLIADFNITLPHAEIFARD